MPQTSKRELISLALGIAPKDYHKFLGNLYIEKEMSAPEISEHISSITPFLITPRSIQRALAEVGITRTTKESFALAIRKGKITWEHQRKNKKTNRLKINKKLRFQILSDDGFKCKLCGADHTMTVLEVDHIVPLCRGGKNQRENLRTLCHECNIGKQALHQEF